MGVSDLDLADKVRGVGLDGPAMVIVNVLLNHTGVWFMLLSFADAVSYDMARYVPQDCARCI